MAMGRSKTLNQIELNNHSGHCNFPAIFNFGDSNSDTGGKSAAYDRLPSPNGDTFFGKPSGRFCDGQLVIDFIGDCSHFPYFFFFPFPLESLRKFGSLCEEECVGQIPI